jgi:hypothetical protein
MIRWAVPGTAAWGLIGVLGLARASVGSAPAESPQVSNATPIVAAQGEAEGGLVVVRADPTAPPRVGGMPGVVTALSREDRAELDAIQQRAAAQVSPLAAQIARDPTSAANAELQERIVALKREARIEHLSRLAALAAAHGDVATAQEAEEALRGWNAIRTLMDEPTTRKFEKEVQ